MHGFREYGRSWRPDVVRCQIPGRALFRRGPPNMWTDVIARRKPVIFTIEQPTTVSNL